MATLTFTYTGKCSGDHIFLDAKLNGATRKSLTVTRAELREDPAEPNDLETIAMILLRRFCRQWHVANPTGTLPQLRAALEAASWEV